MPQRILVIPAYNEARTICRVLDAVDAVAGRIILINDGSRDETASLAAEWGKRHPKLTLLDLPANQGMSGALLCGFAHCHGLLQQGQISPDDLIINIDADGQHRPEEIPDACSHLVANRLDVVLGRRTLEGYPWFKKVGNFGLSLWASLLTGHRYHDVECGFRVMRAAVLPELLTYYAGSRYSCAQEIGIITAIRGFRVENQFPITVPYYRSGTRVRDGITNLWMGLCAAVRVRLGRPAVRSRPALDGVMITEGGGRRVAWRPSF